MAAANSNPASPRQELDTVLAQAEGIARVLADTSDVDAPFPRNAAWACAELLERGRIAFDALIARPDLTTDVGVTSLFIDTLDECGAALVQARVALTRGLDECAGASVPSDTQSLLLIADAKVREIEAKFNAAGKQLAAMKGRDHVRMRIPS